MKYGNRYCSYWECFKTYLFRQFQRRTGTHKLVAEFEQEILAIQDNFLDTLIDAARLGDKGTIQALADSLPRSYDDVMDVTKDVMKIKKSTIGAVYAAINAARDAPVVGLPYIRAGAKALREEMRLSGYLGKDKPDVCDEPILESLLAGVDECVKEQKRTDEGLNVEGEEGFKTEITEETDEIVKQVEDMAANIDDPNIDPPADSRPPNWSGNISGKETDFDGAPIDEEAESDDLNIPRNIDSYIKQRDAQAEAEAKKKAGEEARSKTVTELNKEIAEHNKILLEELQGVIEDAAKAKPPKGSPNRNNRKLYPLSVEGSKKYEADLAEYVEAVRTYEDLQANGATAQAALDEGMLPERMSVGDLLDNVTDLNFVISMNREKAPRIARWLEDMVSHTENDICLSLRDFGDIEAAAQVKYVNDRYAKFIEETETDISLLTSGNLDHILGHFMSPHRSPDQIALFYHWLGGWNSEASQIARRRFWEHEFQKGMTIAKDDVQRAIQHGNLEAGMLFTPMAIQETLKKYTPEQLEALFGKEYMKQIEAIDDMMRRLVNYPRRGIYI